MSGDRYPIVNQELPYFLTITVVEWVDIFSRKEYKIIIVDALNYCIQNKGLEVYAWVIMSNHLHLIVRAKEGFILSHILRDFKKFTSKEIVSTIKEIPESRRDWLLNRFSFEAKRTGRAKYYKVWRDDNHAICLERTDWILQRLNYLHQNPVRQMIVSNCEDYIFSSAVDYTGGKGLVSVTKII
eukprot:gene18088-25398_t